MLLNSAKSRESYTWLTLADCCKQEAEFSLDILILQILLLFCNLHSARTGAGRGGPHMQDVLRSCQQVCWYAQTLVMNGSVIGHMMLALVAFACGLLVFASCQTQMLSDPAACD